MNDTKNFGDYLRNFGRSRGEQRQALVQGRISSEEYMVLLLDTQQSVRASRGQLSTELLPNQTVMVAATAASGRAIGSGYVILSPGGPAGTRGTTRTIPVNTTVIRRGGAVLTVEPGLLSIEQGGTEVLTVYGVGFDTSSVVTFGTAGLSGIVTMAGDGYVEISITASSVCSLGRFKVTLDDQALGDVVDVTVTTSTITLLNYTTGFPIDAAHPLALTVTSPSILSSGGGITYWLGDPIVVRITTPGASTADLYIDNPSGPNLYFPGSATVISANVVEVTEQLLGLQTGAGPIDWTGGAGGGWGAAGAYDLVVASGTAGGAVILTIPNALTATF